MSNNVGFTPFVFSQHKHRGRFFCPSPFRRTGLFLPKKQSDYGSLTTAKAFHSCSQLLQRLRIFSTEMEIGALRMELLRLLAQGHQRNIPLL